MQNIGEIAPEQVMGLMNDAPMIDILVKFSSKFGDERMLVPCYQLQDTIDMLRAKDGGYIRGVSISAFSYRAIQSQMAENIL